MRDVFSTKVEQVTVDSKQVYNEILEYLKGIAPELIDRIKLYEDTMPLFDKANIEQEIRDLFKRRCDLPSGGYLIIEPTEALVSIDVNSGRYTGKKDPEKTILKTNIEAAREVARQPRLRDVGGIIVCDFIDMETKANRDKVLQELRTHLGRDRARTKAFAVSDLGLIEMTRQRVRQSHLQNMTEACPTCHGTGRVFTAETIARRVERSVRRAGLEGKKDPLVVRVHPDVAMYVLENEKDLLEEARESGRLRARAARRSAAQAGRVQARGEVGRAGRHAAVRGGVNCPIDRVARMTQCSRRRVGRRRETGMRANGADGAAYRPWAGEGSRLIVWQKRCFATSAHALRPSRARSGLASARARPSRSVEHRRRLRRLPQQCS